MKRTLGVACFVGWASMGFGCGGETSDLPADEPLGSEADSIVNGFVETSRRYPVALRFEHPAIPGQMELRCSASLIGKRTVLTAGHCVVSQDFPPPVEVAFGQDVYNPDLVIPVASTAVHPEYQLNEFEVVADIGIVELASDAPEQPVGLLYETMAPGVSSKFVGPDITYVGYGTTVSGAPNHGTRRVVTYPLAVVGPGFVQGFPVPETTWLWASRAMAEATCSGDSGGPAFFVEGAVERQLGVHSTSNCESLGTDSKSDQSMIDDFIQAHIDDFEGNDPCRNDGSCNDACQTGTELVDPDCAGQHCAADGICARACVMPVDPDCAWGQTFCQDGDGACNPGCATLDAECEPLCSGDGVCVAGCPTPDPDCSSGTGGAGGAGAGGLGSGGAVGGSPDPIAPAADDTSEDDGGCGCRTAGDRASSDARFAWAALLAAAWLSRRRAGARPG